MRYLAEVVRSYAELETMKNARLTREQAPRRYLPTLLCAALAVTIPGPVDAAMAAPQGKIAQKAKSSAGKAGSAAKKAKEKAGSTAGEAAAAGSAFKQDPLGTVLEVVEETRELARSTRNQVEAIVGRVEIGASFLDGSTFEQIANQARGAVDLMKDQFEGQDEFVSKHAQQFKADLIGFLTDVRTLRHEIRSLTTSSCWPRTQTAERTPLIDLIERIPDGFLYPAWKGIPEEFQCLVQDVREGVESVRTIRAILGELGAPLQVGPLFTEGDALSADATMFAARLEAAQPYLRYHDELSAAASRLSKAAKAADLFSAVLDALAEGQDGSIELGVHGYASVTLKADTLEVLSKTIGAGGKMAGQIASYVDGKLTEARSVSTVNLILMNQEEILRNQKALLER